MVLEVAGSRPVFHPKPSSEEGFFFIMLEKEFTCPYCWENQSRLFDPSILNQNFIEDCEVCCNPIEFNLITNGLDILDFSVNFIGQ